MLSFLFFCVFPKVIKNSKCREPARVKKRSVKICRGWPQRRAREIRRELLRVAAPGAFSCWLYCYGGTEGCYLPFLSDQQVFITFRNAKVEAVQSSFESAIATVLQSSFIGSKAQTKICSAIFSAPSPIEQRCRGQWFRRRYAQGGGIQDAETSG